MRRMGLYLFALLLIVVIYYARLYREDVRRTARKRQTVRRFYDDRV